MRAGALVVAIGVPFAFAAAAGVLSGLSTSAASGPQAAAVTSPPGSSPATPSPSPSEEDHDSVPVDLTAGSESLMQAPNSSSQDSLSSSDIEVYTNVETDDPVYFITIDDGLEQPEDALQLIKDRAIPITAFLTEYAGRPAADYFLEATQFGGSVQNHSMVHGNFNDPKTNVHWEICATQKRYEDTFGYAPWMLRPPYGEGYDNQEVLDVSAECGVSRIVLWNVVVTDKSKVEYWDPPLRPGDIVLLHWNANLADNLETLLQLGDEQGLYPAPLENYI